jgi:hypothetical protein
VSQPIFPAPVLGFNYAYTTTGILREIPTLANGGVERRPVNRVSRLGHAPAELD